MVDPCDAMSVSWRGKVWAVRGEVWAVLAAGLTARNDIMHMEIEMIKAQLEQVPHPSLFYFSFFLFI